MMLMKPPKPLNKEAKMTAQEVIERIMTQHWDMAMCFCWICEAGRKLGYGPQDRYLQHKSKIKVGRVTVERS